MQERRGPGALIWEPACTTRAWLAGAGAVRGLLEVAEHRFRLALRQHRAQCGGSGVLHGAHAAGHCLNFNKT